MAAQSEGWGRRLERVKKRVDRGEAECAQSRAEGERGFRQLLWLCMVSRLIVSVKVVWTGRCRRSAKLHGRCEILPVLLYSTRDRGNIEITTAGAVDQEYAVDQPVKLLFSHAEGFAGVWVPCALLCCGRAHGGRAENFFIGDVKNPILNGHTVKRTRTLNFTQPQK